MLRIGVRTTVCAALIFSGLSCGDPAAPDPDPVPQYESWTLDFVNERSAEYGGPACPGSGDLYCKTWRPDTFAFTGTLYRKKNTDNWTLTLSSGVFVATSSYTSSESGSLGVFLKQDQYCAGYGLTISSAGQSFTGTFGYSRDCHGSVRTGKVSGRR
jgi:hypothetical protein